MRALFLLLLVSHFVSVGQEKKPNLNTLKAPSSPAGFLVGLNRTEIPVFSDKTKLAAELSNQTNGFTQLPKSFAIDFAPLMLFRQNNKEEVKNKGINRNWILSFAYKDSTFIPKNSLFPLNAQIAIGSAFEINFSKENKKKNNNFTKISEETMALPNPRDFIYTKGLKMAFNGGLVYNQNDMSKNHSAAWMSIGSHLLPDSIKILNKDEKENQLVWILMGNVQNNNNESFQNTLNGEKKHFMYGLKLSFNSNQSTRIYFDFEALVKKAYDQNNKKLDLGNNGGFKYDGSVGVELSKNFVLSATVGKEFGISKVQKSGTFFTVLNLAAGIGRSQKDI